MIWKHAVVFVLSAGFTQAAAEAQSSKFSQVVEDILRHQTDGPISEMEGEKKQAMIDCVNGVLADLSDLNKNYILKGSSYEEREHRFGEVLNRNDQRWRDNITAACAGVAMSGDD